MDVDLSHEPIGKGKDGRDVFLEGHLADSPGSAEPDAHCSKAGSVSPALPRFRRSRTRSGTKSRPSSATSIQWDDTSTYIQEPPFFQEFGLQPGAIREIKGARALAIFGDSVTTDHISPAGSIRTTSPAGKYLIEHGVAVEDFNSYGSRRGNDRVMTRGTFANVRIKNLMVPGTEGGVTRCFASKGCECAPGDTVSIYEAAMAYQKEGTPLVVLAGHEYGTGSSRDWAAKGTALLGVKAVVAQSFERIHRSNLVGMGVLPLQFKEGTSAQTLKLDGTEIFDVLGLDARLKAQQDLSLRLTRANGQVETVPVTCRIDTPIEIEYYQHGGILPYVLRQLAARASSGSEAAGKV